MFTTTVQNHVEGIPSSDGLFQALHPLQVEFQKAIRLTAPDFRPFERPRKNDAPPPMVPVPEFLANEESGKNFQPADNSKAIFLDDVMLRINRYGSLLLESSFLTPSFSAVTRELPKNYPYVVKKRFIQEIIGKWNSPAYVLYQATYQALRRCILAIVDEKFEQFGFLKQRVTSVS
jgi:hypothetical protein